MPFEVLGEGEFFVSLIGIHNEDATNRITTERITVNVKTGPTLDAENTSEPIATEMEQALTYLGKARESAANAEAVAAELKESFENGELNGEDGISINAYKTLGALTSFVSSCKTNTTIVLWTGVESSIEFVNLHGTKTTVSVRPWDIYLVGIIGGEMKSMVYHGNIKGEPYVLTDADKAEIANAVREGLTL